MNPLADTIAAISTPLGESGLAVVRLSGPGSLSVVDRCFDPAGKSNRRASEAPTHSIQYGHIKRGGKVVDEVLVSILRAPRTFTKEDVVEISCHGGLLPAKLILDLLLEHGARLAEPGEFTKRAFLNGRIDLTQAEAVADLIHSRTELALNAANEQLAGKLGKRIETLREEMMKILAHVEAHIDFPDEDIEPDTLAQLIAKLREASAFMEALLASAKEGKILRHGIRAAIIGRPNAGKSSLLNQLLGHERAIVSSIPGTTRDTVEETANIRGIPVVFIDTAGIREARDEIEAEGIRRSQQSLEKAELILHVIDGSIPLEAEDERLLQTWMGRPSVVVLNKMDLSPSNSALPSDLNPVRVSALTGQGIEDLKERIATLVWGGKVGPEMFEVMINSRHQGALLRALESTRRTVEALRGGLSIELAAFDLRLAVQAIGEIVGKTTTEDLLDSIFSQFCLGK